MSERQVLTSCLAQETGSRLFICKHLKVRGGFTEISKGEREIGKRSDQSVNVSERIRSVITV